MYSKKCRRGRRRLNGFPIQNNFLLSSSTDKTVRLWHIERKECLCAFQHQDFVTSVAFHPKDDRYFLSGSLDAKLRLWSIPDKKVHCWTQLPELITCVTFTSEGQVAIAGTFVGVCVSYRLRHGPSLQVLTLIS